MYVCNDLLNMFEVSSTILPYDVINVKKLTSLKIIVRTM